MRYTTDKRNILNNYEAEPTVCVAEYSLAEEQHHDAFHGAVAILFVSLLLLTALGIS